jgi:radical SAM protein (TIGR04043 family)
MIKSIKAEIQSLGVKVSTYDGARKSGAGPAEGQLLFLDGVPANVPVSSSYVANSPYFIKKIGQDSLLFKNKNEIMTVKIPPKPNFYRYVTEDGIEYSKIALKHGRDCLATTVFQKCIYWDSNERCKFCGIELSLKNGRTIEQKTPQQLSEVARVAEELDNIKHVVLTTGTVHSSENAVKYISNCTRSIKSTVNLPVHVQIEPPSNTDALFELKEAGVDTVGIHIESFDFSVLSYIAPVKAALGLQRYEKAWEKSVEIFGINQVSSFLIIGLGESRESIIEGAEYLAKKGVYPFLVPIRPIPGSLLQDSLPPPAELMIELYQEVGELLTQNDISSRKSKAGCVRCGACSALPEFEK